VKRPPADRAVPARLAGPSIQSPHHRGKVAQRCANRTGATTGRTTFSPLIIGEAAHRNGDTVNMFFALISDLQSPPDRGSRSTDVVPTMANTRCAAALAFSPLIIGEAPSTALFRKHLLVVHADHLRSPHHRGRRSIASAPTNGCSTASLSFSPLIIGEKPERSCTLTAATVPFSPLLIGEVTQPFLGPTRRRCGHLRPSVPSSSGKSLNSETSGATRLTARPFGPPRHWESRSTHTKACYRYWVYPLQSPHHRGSVNAP
jgi:hypothetical protein